MKTKLDITFHTLGLICLSSATEFSSKHDNTRNDDLTYELSGHEREIPEDFSATQPNWLIVAVIAIGCLVFFCKEVYDGFK